MYIHKIYNIHRYIHKIYIYIYNIYIRYILRRLLKSLNITKTFITYKLDVAYQNHKHLMFNILTGKLSEIQFNALNRPQGNAVKTLFCP